MFGAPGNGPASKTWSRLQVWFQTGFVQKMVYNKNALHHLEFSGNLYCWMTLNDLRVGGLQKFLFLVCSRRFKGALQRIHASHWVINVLAFSYACFIPAGARPVQWLTLFTLLRVVIFVASILWLFYAGSDSCCRAMRRFSQIYSMKRRFLVVSNLRRRHVALLVTPINGVIPVCKV